MQESESDIMAAVVFDVMQIFFTFCCSLLTIYKYTLAYSLEITMSYIDPNLTSPSTSIKILLKA